MSVEELYEQAVKSLSVPDRLRLAIIILNNIPQRAVVDYNDEWTDEDLRDATAYSLRHADESLGEEADDAYPG